MVVGLGRFGSACAECLTLMGQDVIGVDDNERLVQKHMTTLAQSVQADATDIDAMRLVGAGEVGGQGFFLIKNPLHTLKSPFEAEEK